jgi:chromosome segregation ATPase
MKEMKALEEKIASLKVFVDQLVARYKDLESENRALDKQVKMLESSLLKENKSLEDLQKEKEMTRQIVDGLIKSIDSLVGV